jgi:phosphotransferase system  glucose/maltose/N-acetylglucosamine-specific IIC component
VGFNPFRQQVKRRSDIVLVVVAVLVVAGLVLWAAIPR